MRTLYKGLQGDDVRAWQLFLRGVNTASEIQTNGIFDDHTDQETRQFQQTPPGATKGDGVVGPQTFAKAMQLGFNPLEDDRVDEASPGWPPKPAGLRFLEDAEKIAVFGAFKYEAAPTERNPEAIRILDDWAQKNVIQVEIPQLKGINGAPKSCKVPFHRLAAPQLQRAFELLEQRDQLRYIRTWDGTWVPRFIRGSTTRLSNHAFASALDLNVDWNKLGTQGALKGQIGSVREIVMTLYSQGLAWGGWFKSRVDPQHLECFKIVEPG